MGIKLPTIILPYKANNTTIYLNNYQLLSLYKTYVAPINLIKENSFIKCRCPLFQNIPKVCRIKIQKSDFISQYTLEKKSNSIFIYMQGFIMAISSWDYGGWDMPWYALCKLENQETGDITQSKSEALRTRRADDELGPKAWEVGKGGGYAASRSPRVGRPKNQETWCLRAAED